MKWAARIQDVSVGGLSLSLRRRFEPGTGLAIELPGGDSNQPSTVLARVAHVRRAADGSWVLGCAFVSQLSEEEVRALASPLKDQRDRQVGVAPAGKAFLTDVRFEGTLADGSVIRRRIKQLETPAASPPRRGQLLRLRLAFGGHPVAQVRVDSCNLEQGRWILRGTFVDIDSADVLRSFGLPGQAG